MSGWCRAAAAAGRSGRKPDGPPSARRGRPGRSCGGAPRRAAATGLSSTSSPSAAIARTNSSGAYSPQRLTHLHCRPLPRTAALNVGPRQRRRLGQRGGDGLPRSGERQSLEAGDHLSGRAGVIGARQPGPCPGSGRSGRHRSGRRRGRGPAAWPGSGPGEGDRAGRLPGPAEAMRARRRSASAPRRRAARIP